MDGEKRRDQDDGKTTHGSLPAADAIVTTSAVRAPAYDRPMKQP
jgi:hypothetical protein